MGWTVLFREMACKYCDCEDDVGDGDRGVIGSEE